MGDAARIVGGAASSMEQAAAMATKALGLLGGALSVAAFVNMAKGAIDAADAVSKLSQRTGVATEALSQLQYAFKLGGVEGDSLTKGIKKLNVSIAEGLAGDKEKTALFKSLGVTLKDIEGKTKSADKVLLEIADSFSQAKDGASKTAIAVGLLGKAGDEMIPALNGGSQSIRDLMREADKLGLTITSQFGRDAEEFNDNLARIQTQGTKLGILLGTNLVEGTGKAMKAFADAVVEGNKLAGVVAFIQTLLTGDDRHKANGEMIEAAERILRIQNAMDKIAAKGRENFTSGDANAMGNLQKELALMQERYKLAQNYGKVLDEETERAKKAADAIKAAREKGPELPYSKGDDSAAKAAAAAYKSLNDELIKRGALLAEDAATDGKITEARKFELDMLAKLQAASEKLTKSQVLQIEERIHALKLEMDALRESDLVKQAGIDAAMVIAQARQKLRNEDDEASKAAIKQIQAEEYARDHSMAEMSKNLKFEISLMGLNTAERERAIAARELERMGIKDTTEAYAEYLRLVADRAALQKQIDDFGKVWESVDRTAQQTFTNIFDGGQDAFTKLRDTLKSTLLDLLYQMTVRKWVFNIVASVTGANPAAVGSVAAASSGGGLLNLAGGANNLYQLSGLGSGSSVFTQFATSSIGNSLGLSTTVDAIGGLGTASTSLTGIGSALSAAAPYLAAAVAVASIFGGKKGGPKDIGSYGQGSIGPGFTRGDTNTASNNTVKTFVDAIGSSYTSAVKALGGTAGVLETGGLIGADPKGDSLTQLITTSYLNGRQIYDRNNANSGGNFEDVGRSSEALQAAITEASARAVLSALKASDLPVKVADYFNAMDPLQLSADQIQTVIDTATKASTLWTAVDQLGAGFANVSALSVDLTGKLAEAAGGWDALTSGISGFYQAFYSEEEQSAIALQNVTKYMGDLGYSAVDTKEEFRALVEGLDLSTDAGRSLYASLLSIAPAFASVHQAVDAAANSLAAMNAAATSYFAAVDAQNLADNLLGEATAGIDKFIGSTIQSVADAQASQAQAALNAAREAANLWRQAQSSIESALSAVRGGTLDLQPAYLRRSTTLGSLDAATIAALGGDAASAANVGALAQQFLAASKSSSVDRISYLRDRAMAESKLVSVLDKTKAQVTLQEAIASASEATVGQLQIINQTLTGFGAQVFELLSKGYAGADRETATTAAEKLAKATSDFAYFFNTTKEGDVITGGQWGSSKITRLSGDMASFTSSSGVVSYLRAADTIIGLGKQSPELRAIWEQQYGFKLPAFEMGTPYVPQDMIAQIHRGEAIMPAPTAQRWRDSGDGETADAMRDLVTEISRMRKNSDDDTKRIYQLERIIDNWDRNGAPVRNQTGTTLEVTS
ncbi:MAG: hypothetical protein AB7I35_12900 [Ramlibacter sp.]